MTYNKVVDIVHVCFADILLPQFLTSSLINSFLFEVGRLHFRFWTLGTRVRDDRWHLWIWKGIWCLGHDSWLAPISVGCHKVLIQILHCPGKLVRSSQPKDEDVTFQVTAKTLEVGIGLRALYLDIWSNPSYLCTYWNWVLAPFFVSWVL